MFRDGPLAPKSRSYRWFYVAVLAAACVAILFVASGISLWHKDAPGTEDTCPICHVAHMPVLPGTVASLPVTASVIAWLAPAKPQLAHSSFASLDSPPRGPPA